jgi:hypothetical protein
MFLLERRFPEDFGKRTIRIVEYEPEAKPREPIPAVVEAIWRDPKDSRRRPLDQ